MIETPEEAIARLTAVEGYILSFQSNSFGSKSAAVVARNHISELCLYFINQTRKQPLTDHQQVRNELDGFILTIDKLQQAVKQLQEVADEDAELIGKVRHFSKPIHNWITFDNEN